MGKVKIKRKSTLIDMTAMSDVTVLLLTFFMLTSTFLQPEPTIVYSPSSVAEEKVPVSNLVTILVSSADKAASPKGDPIATEGKIFISFAGDVDSTYSSEKLRKMVLMEAVGIYNDQHKNNNIELTDQMVYEFSRIHMFGVPFAFLPEFLLMDPTHRDQLQGELYDPRVGIPYDGLNKDWKSKELNEFQIWLKAISAVAGNIKAEQETANAGAGEGGKVYDLNANLDKMLRQGEGIAVKADKDTPFEVVQLVFDNLQTMRLNKFSLMTALKSEDEQSH